jgi:hypothetical protein
MTAGADVVGRVSQEPAWLAHRYDPGHDAIHFIDASLDARRAVPFLNDENLPGFKLPTVVRRSEAMAHQAQPGKVHFVFHSAYCCSTLLAACFDLPGKALALKEPQLLNDMVGWRHRGAQPQALAQVMNDALTLLARPFEPGEVAVIKPSNIVNGLAEALLATRPESTAILLHAPLRSFLTSIARKGLWGRLWVRELFVTQLADGLVDLGFDNESWLRQSDLQIAAVGWLAQQRLFHRLLQRWPERLRSLNSEVLVADPGPVLRHAAALFGVTVDDRAIAQMIADNFARDTKTGETFSQGQRDAAREAGEAAHRDEIDKVCIWAEAVAAANGLKLDLPLPL